MTVRTADSFGNDDAREWLETLFVTDNPALVTSTLTGSVNWPMERELPIRTASLSLAAAELVAAGKGSPGATLPGEAAGWVDGSDLVVDEQQLALALKAVERIRMKSGLRDFWESNGGLEEWLAALSELERRLSG